MQQNGAIEAANQARQLGPYIVGSAILIGIGLWILARQVIPALIKSFQEREATDRAAATSAEQWARDEVRQARLRLDEAYAKIPVALTQIAERMEQANQIQREAFGKLFDQNARILERLAWSDPRESGAAGRVK